MAIRWIAFGRRLRKVLLGILFLHLQTNVCLSLNLEGLALLEFRSRVEVDPYGVLDNWNPNASDPCNWSGVHCVDGRVEMLCLKEQSLRGTLAPELGKLGHLRALVLYKNKFSGVVPMEIGGLTMLELLDLQHNSLSGEIPSKIGAMPSLKCLLVCGNKFQNESASCTEKPGILSCLEYDQNLSFDVPTEIGPMDRKVKSGIWQSSLQKLKKFNSYVILLQGKIQPFFHFSLFKSKRGSSPSLERMQGHNLRSSLESYVVQDVHVATSVRRRLFEETSNLPAVPVSNVPPKEGITVPSAGSGSFPAVLSIRNGKPKESSASKMPTSPPDGTSRTPPVQSDPLPRKPTNLVDRQPPSSIRLGSWSYALIFLGVALLLSIAASMLFMCRNQGVATIRPWKTGLSGQLQKAFVTGVPKVNRSELEAACEDFSNIVCTSSDYTVFKGTLSSGVEIAVISTTVTSAKDWSKHSEMHFRKKIDFLSRVNHKNFVNLLGYCEENEPFMRMLVFEYAPNGTLFEHLHVKEFEHLDWSARMRIIMGTAYCLQYMHHELKPPVVHPDLQSGSIFITDDFAAKIADISIWKEVIAKGKVSEYDDADHSELPYADPWNNVYSFGILMLEIISGRAPCSEEQGSLVDWAMEYLNDRHSIGYLVDPFLKSFKNEELDIVCEVIHDCIHQDPKKRPTMKEITTKLREVIAISPEAAKPKLSPLWWAELEILSVEAS